MATRWLTTVFAPLVALLPPEHGEKLSPAEYFHEVMEHRWRLSEQAGHEVDIFDAAADYISTVLPGRPPDSAVSLR